MNLRQRFDEGELRRFEGRLLDIGRDLPLEVDMPSSGAFAVMQAQRARSLYRGLLALVDGPSLPSLYVLCRPLVEIAITLAWVRTDPEPRIRRWAAEQERRDLQLIQEMRALGRQGVDWSDEETLALEAQKEERISQLRDELGLAKGALLPTLLEQATEVGSQEASEAYSMAYRSLSPWTHASDAAFRPNFTDGIYEADRSAESDLQINQWVRLIAVSLFGWVLELSGEMMKNDDIQIRARQVIDDNYSAGRL